MDNRVQFMGLPLDGLTMAETIERIEEFVTSERDVPAQHVVLNAGKVVQAREDDDLRSAIMSCDLIGADGMSIVWASRLLRIPVPERVAGIDLMQQLLANAAENGRSVYLLGAHQETVCEVAERLTRRHPDLRIVGVRNGYWLPEEEDDVVTDIAKTHAHLLFVAMPSPKKELFVARHREKLGVRFVMGVGGSFDVIAGKTTRAPAWMQRAGLEWLYRLAQEPSRMFRRYLVGNTRFVLLVVAACATRVFDRSRGRQPR